MTNFLLKTRKENCESRGCISPERGYIGGSLATGFVYSGCFIHSREMAKPALFCRNDLHMRSQQLGEA